MSCAVVATVKSDLLGKVTENKKNRKSNPGKLRVGSDRRILVKIRGYGPCPYITPRFLGIKVTDEGNVPRDCLQIS